MTALSQSEKQMIHDSLRGWPTAEHLRQTTAGWPEEWFDEAIISASAVAEFDALPGIISTLRELRAERRAKKTPAGLGGILRGFSEKLTRRRKVVGV